MECSGQHETVHKHTLGFGWSIVPVLSALLFNKSLQHLVVETTKRAVVWAGCALLVWAPAWQWSAAPLEARGSTGASPPCVDAGNLLVGGPRPGGLAPRPQRRAEGDAGAGGGWNRGRCTDIWSPGLQVHSLTLPHPTGQSRSGRPDSGVWG